MTRRRFVCAGLALLGPLLAAGCGGSGSDGGATIAESGTIRYKSFEGGFYALDGDSGQHYDPTNLGAEFRQDGLRVKFRARPLNQGGTHLYGQIVEITQIQKL